jgi:hypothetical protein
MREVRFGSSRRQSGEFDRGADQDIGADGGAILGATSNLAGGLRQRMHADRHDRTLK